MVQSGGKGRGGEGRGDPLGGILKGIVIIGCMSLSGLCFLGVASVLGSPLFCFLEVPHINSEALGYG